MLRKIFVGTEIVAGDHSTRVDLGAFTHLRFFHGCRPTFVHSFYTEGIRVLSVAELAERFREIYADIPPAVWGRRRSGARRKPFPDRRRRPIIVGAKGLRPHGASSTKAGENQESSRAIPSHRFPRMTNRRRYCFWLKNLCAPTTEISRRCLM